MAHIADKVTLVPKNANFSSRSEGTLLWQRVALGSILLLSIYINLFQLGQNGFGSHYYAAGVRSMVDSWHNFFFLSFDPGGFVTIDKPAVDFWLQALSVKLFGYTAFSIFLPQAICGMLAVLFLFYLVRRHFGTTAGLIAALSLAVSPISIVTDRNNTVEGTLALILLLSVWAVMRACETGKLRWLLLSGAFVGLGFNTKMAEAYLIIPALGMAYLLCGPRKIWTCIWHLLIALVVMLLISLSWATAVDLTPAPQRPYVGSTQNNSEISLAFGYNGLKRLHLGSGTVVPSTNNTTTKTVTRNTTAATKTVTRNTTAASTQNDAVPPNTIGPLRLFNGVYGSQIAWLLPFALLAILALVWRRDSSIRQDQQRLERLGLVIWGFWLLTMTVFFTLDSFFHEYYLTIMAPGLCALVGIGMVVMWRQYCTSSWHGWLLPIALAVTAAAQLSILAYYPSWFQHLSLFIAIPMILVVLVLLIFRLLRRKSFTENTFRSLWDQTPRKNALHGVRSVAGVGLFVLLIAPMIWTFYTVANDPDAPAPTAGPSITSRFSNFLFTTTTYPPQGLSTTDGTLISYLERQQGHTKFLLATLNISTADALVMATNRPVMAMGGFNGSDPILTLPSLQTFIKNETIRFFMISALHTSQETIWVKNHCKVVPKKDWQDTKTSLHTSVLYDCASRRP